MWLCPGKKPNSPTPPHLGGGGPSSLNDHSIPMSHQSRECRILFLLLLKQGWWPLAPSSIISTLIYQRNVWSAGLCGPSTVTQRFWDRTGHNLWTPRPEEQRCLLGCGCVRQLAHSVGMEKDHRTECFLYPYVLILGLNKKELHIRLERSGRILGVADNSVNSSLTLIHGFCISFPALSSPLIWKAIRVHP